MPKAYVSKLTTHFGSATITGALYPIRSSTSNKPKYNLCTPDGKPVNQVYRDEDGEVWSKDQLKRMVVEEEVKVVSQTAVQDAKTSELPLNTLNLTAHPVEDVDKFIFPSANQAYIYKPIVKGSNGKEIKDPVNVQWYDFVNVLLRDANVALIGLCNLQNHEGLFRLGLYQGWTTVQKQLYPEELNQYDNYFPSIGAEVRDKAVEVSRKTTKAFDAKEYVDHIARRLQEVGTLDDTDETTRPLAPVPSEINMLEALESFGV